MPKYVIRKLVSLQDTEYFCNKSWTLSYNMNTRSWISFHSYIPNWYIAENNFFYSGINGCCDEFDFIVGTPVNEPTTTSTTTLYLSTTTSTTIIPTTSTTTVPITTTSSTSTTTTTVFPSFYGIYIRTADDPVSICSSPSYNALITSPVWEEGVSAFYNYDINWQPTTLIDATYITFGGTNNTPIYNLVNGILGSLTGDMCYSTTTTTTTI